MRKYKKSKSPHAKLLLKPLRMNATGLKKKMKLLKKNHNKRYQKLKSQSKSLRLRIEKKFKLKWNSKSKKWQLRKAKCFKRGRKPWKMPKAMRKLVNKIKSNKKRMSKVLLKDKLYKSLADKLKRIMNKMKKYGKSKALHVKMLLKPLRTQAKGLKHKMKLIRNGNKTYTTLKRQNKSLRRQIIRKFKVKWSKKSKKWYKPKRSRRSFKIPKAMRKALSKRSKVSVQMIKVLKKDKKYKKNQKLLKKTVQQLKKKKGKKK
jgi:hypothetical protein